MALNCILITVDCLRSDRVGYAGYHRKTPFIDSMADNALVFTQAVSTGPSTPTSFPGILASMYGLDRLSEYGLPNDITTLADKFSKNGYQTGAFHSNPYLNAAYGYSKGFDKFWDYESQADKSKFSSNIREKIRVIFGNDSRINKLAQNFRNSKIGTKIALNLSLNSYPYCPAAEIFSNALQWIKKTNSPIFAWIHLMDIHTPYIFRNNYLSMYRQKIPEKREMLKAGIETTSTVSDAVSDYNLTLLSDLYDSGLRYVDDQIKFFVNSLEKMKIMDSTLLALTSDHGEAFCEHGYFGHLNRLNYQTHFLHEEVIRIPLLFYSPSQINGEVKKELISLLELGPMLLELSKCRRINEHGQEKSKSLNNHDLKKEKLVFCEGTTLDYGNTRKNLVAVRTDEWKYIYNEATGNDELYNLSKDPGETINLYNKRKAEGDRLKAKIDKHILNVSDKCNKDQTTPQEQTDDQMIIKRLKDLGYM